LGNILDAVKKRCREREHVNIAFHLVIGHSLTLNYICHTGEYTYDDGEDRKNKKDDR